ncbi:MAG: hypothetical protein QOJ19_4955 [Acidimicrobiia bacterium]|nr:hypothetical protein [Acidimicrobiia bacterium]
MVIDTALLIIGHGPAPLVVAKVASGFGLQSVVAGHEVLGGETPFVLDSAALEVLRPHGVFDVLRPYLAATEPPAIAPIVFEEVLKHHCVVDMNVTVFDGLVLVESTPRGGGVRGVLTDGRTRWEVSADAFVDAGELPSDLPASITASAEVARLVLAARH